MTQIVITGLEAQARVMIEASRVADPPLKDGWSYRQMIRQVFTAHWSLALTADSVALIAGAINSFTMAFPDDIKKALQQLVRSGLLRSRMIKGERHYELNFVD